MGFSSTFVLRERDIGTPLGNIATDFGVQFSGDFLLCRHSGGFSIFFGDSRALSFTHIHVCN